MRKIAALRVVQQKFTDILNKDGKLQTVIAREAGSVNCFIQVVELKSHKSSSSVTFPKSDGKGSHVICRCWSIG